MASIPREQAGSNRRTENRGQHTGILYPVVFQVRVGDKKIPSTIANYHYKGACLKIEPAFHETLLESGHEIFVEISLGKKVLKQDLPARIAWQSLEIDGLVGVEFRDPISFYARRKIRFDCHPLHSPTVVARDVFAPERTIFFQVVNLSEDGMCLTTSLSNKHLLPGFELQSKINFPGSDSFEAKLKIANTRKAGDEKTFRVGVVVDSPKYSPHFAKYVELFVPIEEAQESVEPVNKKVKKIREGLTFKILENENEYEELLRLRYEAYRSHGKVADGTTWEDQGEGLAKEGIVIGAYLKGKLVASMELRFLSDACLPMYMEWNLDDEKFGLKRSETVQVNRLAIHPRYQGTDIVLGMIQKIHAILLAKGGFHVLMVCTEKLIPLYQNIGFKRTGTTISHPKLTGVFLHAMILPKHTYMEAKKINPFKWYVVYQRTQSQFEQLGLVKDLRLSLWKRIIATGSKVVASGKKKKAA